MANLALYKKNSCPFCQKVMSFMEQNQIQGVTMKDIDEESANKDYLIEKGGKNQVPCLFIDGEPLYESNDIIAYFKENLLDGKTKESKAEEEGPGMCPMF